MDVKGSARVAVEYVAGMEQLTRSNSSGTEGEDFQYLDQLNFSIGRTSFDDARDAWVIEVGLTRPRDKARANPLVGGSSAALDRRTIKTVGISDSDEKNLIW